MVIDGEMVEVDDLKEIECVVKANIEKVGLDPVNYLKKRMAIYRKNMDNPSSLKILRIENAHMAGRKMKTLIGD